MTGMSDSSRRAWMFGAGVATAAYGVVAGGLALGGLSAGGCVVGGLLAGAAATGLTLLFRSGGAAGSTTAAEDALARAAIEGCLVVPPDADRDAPAAALVGRVAHVVREVRESGIGIATAAARPT